MSWSDRLRVFAALALAAALSGCFQPIYGEAAHPGLVQAMREIEVEPVPDRIGHYLTDELISRLNGSGSAANRIVYGAYGTGAKPILTTAIVLPSTGWTTVGGDVYSRPLPTQTRMVTAPWQRSRSRHVNCSPVCDWARRARLAASPRQLSMA